MLSLFLTFALAACPPMFGKKNADGSWNFAEGAPQAGMVEVEVDENCKAQADDLELVKGKFKVNAARKAALIAAEEAEIKLRKDKHERLKAIIEKADKGSLTDKEKDDALKLLLEKLDQVGR